MKTSYLAAEIAKAVEGKVRGDGSVRLSGFSMADSAQPGDLTFAENPKYFALAEASAATAILVDTEFEFTRKVLIRVANARVAFAKVLPLFFPEPVFEAGIHPTVVTDPSASIDPTAHIGPHCHIGANVQIGARVVLEGGDSIGADCQLGEGTHLFPNVTIYPRTQIGSCVRIHAGCVIGSDGFGYVFDCGIHHKVPQIGNVEIQDNVEIGANVTIDRGALGSTIIGKGTKIDNLVQIAHNVVIGENCLVVAQAGIAGSTKLGSYVTLAGQVGLAGHLKIGNRVTIAAQSGVMHDVGDGEKWFGSPAQPDRKMKRQLIAAQQLPSLLRRVSELEKRISRLSEATTNEQADGNVERNST
ncbi:MAG: UDP-3-O-(3-hydroxymyristoyl)glucosamine N-acyltransferase [Verrucomicrobia bacterium]|nr:UDP-3-O-(3-hydroxymyristoyl)glucosamine N-acyltransferase [Verrucomicrobiota bacterium]